MTTLAEKFNEKAGTVPAKFQFDQLVWSRHRIAESSMSPCPDALHSVLELKNKAGKVVATVSVVCAPVSGRESGFYLSGGLDSFELWCSEFQEDPIGWQTRSGVESIINELIENARDHES